MGKIKGTFALPHSSRLGSQLINDTGFSSIREYVLNSESLSGTTQLDIEDLPQDTIIYRIELIVLEGFSDLSGTQHDLSVSTGTGIELMNKNWNDPNTPGTYVTNCYATSINGSKNPLHIIHNITNALSGVGILRIHMYTNQTDEIEVMRTSDDERYLTIDTESVIVNK